MSKYKPRPGSMAHTVRRYLAPGIRQTAREIHASMEATGEILWTLEYVRVALYQLAKHGAALRECDGFRRDLGHTLCTYRLADPEPAHRR